MTRTSGSTCCGTGRSSRRVFSSPRSRGREKVRFRFAGSFTILESTLEVGNVLARGRTSSYTTIDFFTHFMSTHTVVIETALPFEEGRTVFGSAKRGTQTSAFGRSGTIDGSHASRSILGTSIYDIEMNGVMGGSRCPRRFSGKKDTTDLAILAVVIRRLESGQGLDKRDEM